LKNIIIYVRGLGIQLDRAGTSHVSTVD